MNLTRSPLVTALREPQAMLAFSAADWDLLVRQGLNAGLLGRLGAQARERGIQTRIPAQVWRHMQAILSVAERQRVAVRWEVGQLARALDELPGRVVLLKGAAYAAADLPPAAGRTFSDIDILVPRPLLGEVEKRLLLTGWISSHLDDYDQRYYRRWMHELPPMTHIHRGTNLDVHHNILPETARTRTRPDLILAAATPLAGHATIFVPCLQDQVLHSATHLFHEGEWEHGLRDLSDLDCLLRAHAAEPDYWTRLLARAEALNLRLPLGYALRLAASILQTPLPPEARTWCTTGPGGQGRSVMDAVFTRGLGAAHWSLGSGWTRPACQLLYVRSHWLRMPLRLLLPHLLHKAWVRTQAERADERPNNVKETP